MSMFLEFAELDDLASYMGKDKSELPGGTAIMLKRASELVGIAMRNNYNHNYESHREAAKLAVCSQCQSWIENEIGPVVDKNISSYSLGELSVTYSDVDKLSSKLCSTAVRYLNHKCLLYKGMR